MKKFENTLGEHFSESGTDVIVCPAFVDVHVHLREPGFSYKETIFSGSRAAAAGGYRCVCAMPNLNPAPDSVENIGKELDIIRRDACIDVRPYATITKGRKGLEPVDIESLAPLAAGFSDDGSGVDDDGLMQEAMERIAACGSILAAHCEDKRYGDTPESEWKQIERDIRLSEKTGCPYHVCHISTASSVSLIRDARKSGVNVSCETAPHYLMLCDRDIKDDGRFRMNPPLRTSADREALLEGILDGTIEIIATDHAPHSAEEKSRGYAGSVMGIVGLETAFPVLYTGLVRRGLISLDRLIELMSINPARRFRLGTESVSTVKIDISNPYVIDSGSFLSKGHSTPFDGMEVYGRCLETVIDGKIIYKYSI